MGSSACGVLARRQRINELPVEVIAVGYDLVDGDA